MASFRISRDYINTSICVSREREGKLLLIIALQRDFIEWKGDRKGVSMFSLSRIVRSLLTRRKKKKKKKSRGDFPVSRGYEGEEIDRKIHIQLNGTRTGWSTSRCTEKEDRKSPLRSSDRLCISLVENAPFYSVVRSTSEVVYSLGTRDANRRRAR